MKQSVAIRPATPADLDMLTALEARAFAPDDRFARRNLRRMLTSKSASLVVAELDGQPAGSAILLFRKGARMARLYSIATDPAFSGRGVGKALIAACEAEARRRQCDRLRLEVRTGNQRAVELYRRSGFSLRGAKKAYYADGEDALVFERTLNGANAPQ